MRFHSQIFSSSCALIAALVLAVNVQAAKDGARVTQIVREVKLLPGSAAARAAALNDTVYDGTAVRTGDSSRSELTFTDLTITRVGANSIFSFNKAGRNVDIETGSVLLRVPKNSGGGAVVTSAVTAGITGTTVIMEASRSGRSRLVVLEGGARLSLNNHRDQVKDVRAGQALEVPAGAATLPDPVDIDLNETLRKHPLLAGFPRLPSQPLIVAAAQEQRRGEPVYQGQPVAGQPGAPTGGGLRIPPGYFPNPFANPAGPGAGTGGGASSTTPPRSGAPGTTGDTSTSNPNGPRGSKVPPRGTKPPAKKNPQDPSFL
ncbi:MAG: FecR domain-containing protein [Chthoniobacterales bacterium]